MQSRYETVKEYLLGEIRSNRWSENERILSENELVTTCDVSRMTARRAIKELENDGILYSVRGKGTFVTPAKAQSSAVELRNIAEEIRGRQHSYSCRVLEHEIKQHPALAKLFKLQTDELYYSRVIHCENDLPIQLEERYVNPTVATNYLTLDLTTTTANEYLIEICPISAVEHQIEAVKASSELAEHLAMSEADPCLKLTRMTRDRGTIVSLAKLYHPGDRFMLGSQFENQA